MHQRSGGMRFGTTALDLPGSRRASQRSGRGNRPTRRAIGASDSDGMTTAHEPHRPPGRLLGAALHLLCLALVRIARILALPVPRLHPASPNIRELSRRRR